MASPQEEAHTLRGAIDRPALFSIRDIIEEMEPLATARLDDYLTPSVLEVSLDDGLCDADGARIDVQWTTQDDYKFHYTDTAGVNLRWGNHPHGGETIPTVGTTSTSLEQAITIRRQMQVQNPLMSRTPVSVSPPKRWSPVPFSNSGESPIIETRTHCSTLEATLPETETVRTASWYLRSA